MLFNIEMISRFLSDYDIKTEIVDDKIQFGAFRFCQSSEDIDEAVLNIWQKADDVICFNRGNKITVISTKLADVINTVSSRMIYYNDWERRALNAVATRRKLSEYLELLGELFPGLTIKLLDALGRIHYTTDASEIVPKPMTPFVMTLLHDIPACQKISLGIRGVTLFWSSYYKRQYLYGNFVFPNGSFIIFSIFSASQNAPHLSTADLNLAKLAQSIFERANIDAIDNSGLVLQRNFIMNILDGQESPEILLKDLESMLGWTVLDGAYFALVENYPNNRFAARALPYTISEELPTAFTFNYHDDIVCIFSGNDHSRVCRTLAKLLVPIDFRAGVSLPFASWSEIPNAYRQARLSVPHEEKCKTYLRECRDNLWHYYVELFRVNGGEAMIHPDINSILHNNPHNGQVHLDTLYCYLRNNCSMVKTAADMNLHINTLKYRMEKIREEISFDMDDYDSRMAFLVSCDIQWSGG